MAKCGDCFHYPVCQQFVDENESFPELKKGCMAFKNKADYPRVVRCRDCKYWKCWRSSGEGTGDCNLDAGYQTLATQHYDFCSYGERREGE